MDWMHLGAYRENNRIEAKKATGGLPESIWETYSAFANADGGMILLGVIEREDRSLEAIGLVDPQSLVMDFWAMVNDPGIASANILSDGDVAIQDIGGKQIVSIQVPKASVEERPVYVCKDLIRGTYIRSGDGDYRCTPSQILEMMKAKGGNTMLAYTYLEKGLFKLMEKPKPRLQSPTDAIVRVTMSSICTSDLHIKHGSVPRAVPGITVGHEMVGVVVQVGSGVTKVKPGDRVTVNVETFCGQCFFCQNGWVNNCTDPDGGWALGCRIDGGQAEFVRVPLADQGLNKIPDGVTDLQALLVGDVLATGFWAAKISEIKQEDTVLILGAGPTGICTLQCVRLYRPKHIIVCDIDQSRLDFVRKHYPEVVTATPEDVAEVVKSYADHGGADVVLEVAGGQETFRMAWQLARPNAIVTVVALYDEPQELPLPQMYGKNLTFKTGGVDGCHCDETLSLIAQGKLDTTPLITHCFPLSQIERAYDLFEHRKDGVIKVAIFPDERMNE